MANQTQDQINALDNNLNNILFWANAEMKKIEFESEKLSVKIEIENVLDLYAFKIKDKNITTFIDFDMIHQVFLPIPILQTLLRNTISNAIKFSRQDGKVTFTCLSDNNMYFTLGIKDEGIGINNQLSANGKSIKETYPDMQEGLGLGILICRELSKFANFELDMVPNENGIGTLVKIKMPKT